MVLRQTKSQVCCCRCIVDLACVCNHASLSSGTKASYGCNTEPVPGGSGTNGVFGEGQSRHSLLVVVELVALA